MLEKNLPNHPIEGASTLADEEDGDAAGIDDADDVDADKAAAAEGLENLGDALDDATDGLADQAATMPVDDESDDAYAQKIDGEIAYFESFADQYQDMLNAYDELKQQYKDAYGDELPGDIQDAFDKLLSQENLKKLQSVIKCMYYLRDAERGFDMYVTADGVNFTTLTTNGFNDPYNHGLRTFAVTNQGLCLGTANPFNGCQVWIQRKENSENPVDPDPDPTEPSKPNPSNPNPSNPSNPGSTDKPNGSTSSTTTVSKTTKKAEKSSLPGTGDSTAALVAGLLIAAVAVLAVAFGLRKRSGR